LRALVRTLLLSAAHVARHHADLLDNSLFRQHVVVIGVVLHRVMCIMPVAVSATSCPDCRTPSPRPQTQLSPASLSGSTLHHAQRRTSRLSIGSVQRRLITDCQWWAGGCTMSAMPPGSGFFVCLLPGFWTAEAATTNAILRPQHGAPPRGGQCTGRALGQQEAEHSSVNF